MWFDFLDLSGNEYVSAYVAQDGQILTASCTTNSIKVRPAGENDTYPPTVTSGNPEGYSIIIDLGNDEILSVNATAKTVLLQAETLYTRSSGSLEGRLNGGPLLTGGVALFEEFKMTA